MHKLLFAVAAIVGTASAADATNLIANGDFSTFNSGAAGPGYTFRSYGDDQLADWTQNVISGNNGGLVVVLPSSTLNDTTIHDGGATVYSFWSTANGGFSTITAPPSGNPYVFAQDSAPENTSYLSQTVNGLVAGQTYAITFNWAGLQLRSADGSNWNGDTNEKWEVNLGGTYDGGTSQTFTGGTTLYTNTITDVPSHGFVGWETASLRFVATGASEVLNLEAVSSSGGMPPFALIDNLQLNAVPEPATWAMMLIGVAGMGAVARRRRSAALAV
jgi:hypothetical protein